MTRALVLTIAVVSAAGCSRDCSPRAGPLRPNVLFVTVDTLRADHLGAYGNRRVATPHFDRLAAAGVVFERAYASSHVTLPSHVSLFGSLPVVEHGIVDHASPAVRPVRLLPELFRQEGYRTAAFASAVHLGPRRALGQLLAPGLDHFEVPARGPRTFRAAETNARLLDWIRGDCRTPFFAWVHYWDPHMPYAPEPPFDSTYYHGDPYAAHHTSMEGVQLIWFAYDLARFRRHLAPEASSVRELKRTLGASSRQVKDLVLYPQHLAQWVADPAARAPIRERLRGIGARVRPRLPLRRDHADWLAGVRDVEFPRAQYAGEVSYTDDQFGHVLAELERLGIADRTIIVLTADHGESLGEHGLWFEHLGLHDPVVRVPLIFAAPRLDPGRRGDPASGLDVAPTTLALAGLPIPAAMRGRNLFGAEVPEAPIVSEAVRQTQVALIQGDWKLVRTERGIFHTDAFEREAGTIELYDLASDPGEHEDRAAAEPARVQALVRTLDAWLDAHRAAAPVPAPTVPGDRLDDLRALGYVE